MINWNGTRTLCSYIFAPKPERFLSNRSYLSACMFYFVYEWSETLGTCWQCLTDCNAQKKNIGSTIGFYNLASSIEITYMQIAIEPGDLVSTKYTSTKYIISYFRKWGNNLLAAAVQIHDVTDKNEHFHLQSTPCANVSTEAKGSNRITLKNYVSLFQRVKNHG